MVPDEGGGRVQKGATLTLGNFSRFRAGRQINKCERGTRRVPGQDFLAEVGAIFKALLGLMTTILGLDLPIANPFRQGSVDFFLNLK